MATEPSGHPGLSDDAFRSVVEEAPDAIVLVDHAGQIAFVNARTEELFGYGRSELVGQRVEMLVPLDQRAMHTIHREIYQERPEKRPMGTGLELYGQRKDGTTFPVEISLSPSRESGTTLTVAVVRDVTRQRRSEEALRRSEERHRLLNERAENVIFRYRLLPESGFEYVSSAVRRSLGYAPEEFYVNPQLLLDIADPLDREALARALSGTPTSATAVRFRTREAGTRWFELSAAVVRGADQTVVALEGVARDVTERRVADEERLQLLAEVEMQLERNRIAGDLHDDTVQSIYAIGLGLHAMRDDDSVGRTDVVDRTIEGLNGVIASLRSYMHRLSGDRSDIDDREPLGDRIAALVAGSTSPRWQVDVDRGLSLDPTVERQLYLLAKEITSNVRRHSAAKTATLSLALDAAGDLVLAVTDDGVGFEQEDVGAGSFGLRSVALRAEALGAATAIDSKPGAGTRVRVCVPAASLTAAGTAGETRPSR